MCGIAGVIRIHDPSQGHPPHPLEAIPEAWLDVLDESIKHRGPDGQGRFRDRAIRPDGTVVDVALVHRRLSIIDHAGGHQPMVHDGQRLRPDLTYQPGETPKLAHEIAPGLPLVAVAFNGCIYNHRELRAELESLGHHFETDHSDTEVLVHGWREWGLGLVDALDGMHASLVWDRAGGQLGIGRDSCGEKPLYDAPLLSLGAVGLVLSSTVEGNVRQQYHTGQAKLAIQTYAADRWIQFGTWRDPVASLNAPSCSAWTAVPTPPQHAGAHKGGAIITPILDETRIMHRSRTSPVRHSSQSVSHLNAESLNHILALAVTSRLEADVPIGVFLSGGIDSALIAAVAKQHRPDIKSFTVRMSEAAFDESADAAETAKAIGIDHTILDCEPSPAADLVHLIHQLGLPFGDSSLLPTYWVSKAAREHVKVALSGDGGDELFGGYRRHTINPILNRYHHLLKLIPERLLDRRTPGSRSDYLARLAIAARHDGYPELLAIFQTPDLLRLIKSIDGDTIEPGEFRATDDPLRHDFEHYLPDDLLRKTDTASMAVGLEVRAPFLARELVEAALRTPLSVLMPRGQRKGLLKQIALRYLPDHIVNRPKQGFAIPIGEWFRNDFGSMRTLLYDHLEAADPFPGLASAGVELNMSYVRQMLREHDAAGERSINPWHGRDHSQRLYMLLVLSIWSKWLADSQ